MSRQAQKRCERRRPERRGDDRSRPYRHDDGRGVRDEPQPPDQQGARRARRDGPEGLREVEVEKEAWSQGSRWRTQRDEVGDRETCRKKKERHRDGAGEGCELPLLKSLFEAGDGMRMRADGNRMPTLRAAALAPQPTQWIAASVAGESFVDAGHLNSARGRRTNVVRACLSAEERRDVARKRSRGDDGGCESEPERRLPDPPLVDDHTDENERGSEKRTLEEEEVPGGGLEPTVQELVESSQVQRPAAETDAGGEAQADEKRGHDASGRLRMHDAGHEHAAALRTASVGRGGQMMIASRAAIWLGRDEGGDWIHRHLIHRAIRARPHTRAIGGVGA